MAKLKQAPTDTRIYGVSPKDYRDIDSNLLKLATEQSKKAVEAGLPPQLAAMIVPLVILEGNGKPFGVIKGQDVAAKRLPALLKASNTNKPDNFGRLSTDGVPIPDASLSLLSDKFHSLKASGKDYTIADILNKFNGDSTLQEKTGKTYAEHVGAIFDQIMSNGKNSKLKAAIEPFLKP